MTHYNCIQGLAVTFHQYLRVIVLFCSVQHIALEMKAYCITVDTIDVHYYHDQMDTILRTIVFRTELLWLVLFVREIPVVMNADLVMYDLVMLLIMWKEEWKSVPVASGSVFVTTLGGYWKLMPSVVNY